MTIYFLEKDEVLVKSLIPELKNKIRLGLCCINNELRNRKIPIFCNRTMIRANFTVEKAKNLSLLNVQDISKILLWNEKNNIKHYRLSSDMFPHYTDTVTEKYDMKFAHKDLIEAGKLANNLGHRITMHPGQYCQIGAKTESVFEKTIQDLSMHAEILDTMNIDLNGILCIHGGGTYGDKQSTTRRWIEQFDDLPRNVKNRIAIENCEKGYSVRDCLEIANACKIPMIYDNLHYICYDHYHPNEQQEPIIDMLDEVIATWKSWGRDCIPLFHLAQQSSEKSYVGAHSDFVDKIPDHMLYAPILYNTPIHMELEAKAKEEAIFKLQKKYKEIF